MNELQKTVIVFSTYYNSPLFEDKLFNKESCGNPKRITGEKLCDFFWDKLKLDNEQLKQIWFSYLDDNAKQELAIVKRIEDKRKERKDKLVSFLEKNKSKIREKYPEEKYPGVFEFEDLEFLDGNIETDFPELANLFYNYKAPNENEIIIDVLKEQKGSWISSHLKMEGQQDSTDICFGPYNRFSEELKDKPLLSYRFSYYKLKDSNDHTEVYAVWPLSATTDDDGKGWIDALSEQFGKKADRLYLVLHDKDIKDVAFKIHSFDFYEQSERLVILFQHDKKQISPLLKNEHTANEIGDHMEQIRNYHLLNEAYEYLNNFDYESLFNCCNKLPDNYKAIKKDVENLIKMSENNNLFSNLEDRIINEIGKTRP